MPDYDYEKIEVSLQDNIAIISYKCIFEFHKDLFYEIVIGIGNYIPNEVSDAFYSIDKCLAKLKYNWDLSLYDIDFYIDSFNRTQERRD